MKEEEVETDHFFLPSCFRKKCKYVASFYIFFSLSKSVAMYQIDLACKFPPATHCWGEGPTPQTGDDNIQVIEVTEHFRAPRISGGPHVGLWKRHTWLFKEKELRELQE